MTRATLPPPEWVREKRDAASAPECGGLARRTGMVAEEGTLRARLRAARANGDAQAERRATTQLARWLAMNERDLEEAVELARSALRDHEDPPLRRELAAWLEGLGDPGLAAGEIALLARLGGIEASRAAQLLVRAGVLRARAGDASGALEALQEAARIAPADPIALELAGTLGAWAGEEVTPARAAAFYVEAAERRAAAGERETAREDLLRALAADPACVAAAAALAERERERDEADLADEVLRACAADLASRDVEGARRGHEARLRTALAEADGARAIGAALDADLDARFDGDGEAKFDEVLQRLGLLEALAVRLAMRAHQATGRARSSLLLEHARLWAGPLADRERAARAYAEVLVADPGNREAVAALRARSEETGDESCLRDALRHALAAGEGDVADRLYCARLLASATSERAPLAPLHVWALRKVLAIEPEDASAEEAIRKNAAAVASIEDDLELTAKSLATATGDMRADVLLAYCDALEVFPDLGAKLAAALNELCALRPNDLEVRRRAMRAAESREDWAGLAGLARGGLAGVTDARDRAEMRLALARAEVRRGDVRAALAAVLPLLDTASRDRFALAWIWALAAIVGDREARARAIASLAEGVAAEPRSVLLAVASELLLGAGERAEARRLAELACQNDSHGVRAVAALAQCCVGASDRSGAAALERAATLSVPRLAWCLALGDALEGLGQPAHALAWTRRAAALRPGDASLARTLLVRAIASKDASSVAAAIEWVLDQPLPARAIADALPSALEALGETDGATAAAIARRLLESFGPRHAGLRAAVLAAASAGRDDALACAVLERWVAAGAPVADRAALYLSIAAHHAARRDADAEARALLRALREGAPRERVAGRLASLVRDPLGPDGELALHEARALLAERAGEPREAATAYRLLGAARWDLAGDTAGAVEAWLAGARLAPRRGIATLGGDLVRFGGPELASETLLPLAAQETDPIRRSALLAEAARAALAGGQPERALDLARRALDGHPSCGDALELAERASVSVGKGSAMSSVYDHVAARSLGRFGRRAAHHRGARFFEQLGDPKLALKHAAEAFRAVPAEGTTFTMLARAAQRSGGHAAAVSAIESVADQARDAAVKAGWLLRAARVAGRDEEGAKRRFDLLIRAALVSPDGATLALLGDAAREVLDVAPGERERLRSALTSTAASLASRLDGPEGARVAVAFAELALALFDDADEGFASIERALHADGDIEEFDRLVPFAASLAAGSRAAEGLSKCVAIVDKPYSNVGVPALKLIANVARELGDVMTSTKALVAAAEKEPDDVVLVTQADAATNVLGDAPLSQRLDRRIPPARRAEALRAVAAQQLGDGLVSRARETLERALALAPEEMREEIEAELHRIDAAADDGFSSAPPVEPQPVVVDAHTARPWIEVALELEDKGDLEGALDAYEHAAEREIDAIQAYEGMARVAEAAGNHDARVSALQRLAMRIQGEARRETLKRLATAYQVAGDTDRAEAILRKILQQAPEDDEADSALEALIAERGDAAELAEYLAGRVERLAEDPERREVLRVVRMRRAALLEQRLGLVDAARTELEKVYQEWPDSEMAASYLADLYDRTGEPERAIRLWQQMAERADDPQRRADLELRIAHALHAMGESTRSLDVVGKILAANPSAEEALRLRVEIARRIEDDRELGDALDQLVEAGYDEAHARSDMLVEAAQAAARAGDTALALARARRAARIAPERAAVQLFARGMEYRIRGAGAPDDARQTLEELGRIRGELDPEDAALATFLAAEALDATQGGSAGMQRLVEAYEQQREQPLVCLGIAERLVLQGRFEESLAFFDRALAGSLLGLRSAGRVALAAADAAARAGDLQGVARFLDEAARDPETAAVVAERRARAASEPDTLASIDEREEPEEPIVPPPPEQMPDEPSADGTPPSDRVIITEAAAPRDLERAIVTATTRDARSRARLALARVNRASGDFDTAESLLWEAVGDGSAEAADELGDLLEGDANRAPELLKVRRHAVELVPGDLARLERLRRAAVADQNMVYARALEHVLRAFDPGAGPLPPPPLSVQIEQPGMLMLLTRHSHEPANEALGIVWEGGSAAFARSMASYAITGLERVVPGPATVLGRLYEVTARLLDAPRIPLFARRAMGRLSASVALLSPPSAVLTGETRDDTTELRFVLGQALAAALPQNALVLGLPEADARVAWNAVIGGFGPPEYSKALDHLSGPVAETLWQVLPARAQRRLKELLEIGARTDFELVIERARQSGRRVGMFLTGDFGFAARALLGEYVNVDVREIEHPGALLGFCAQFPSLADLYRLAVRPEYADARWHPVPAASQRGTIATGRFSLV